jgi:ABC-2 type transport system ATP-binding protein
MEVPVRRIDGSSHPHSATGHRRFTGPSVGRKLLPHDVSLKAHLGFAKHGRSINPVGEESSVLRLHQVCKSYQDKKVLESLTFDFTSHGVYAIAGPNGIGKSTLFRVIAGAEPPSSGRVELDGLSPSVHRIAYRMKVSWAPEMDAVFPFVTPEEYFRLILQIRGRPGSEFPHGLIEELSLAPFLRTRFDELSLGNKKKTLLIAALMVPFDLLLLDEACTGFDRPSQQTFKKLMTSMASKAIILLVNHDADQLEGIPLTPLQMVHEQNTRFIQGELI